MRKFQKLLILLWGLIDPAYPEWYRRGCDSSERIVLQQGSQERRDGCDARGDRCPGFDGKAIAAAAQRPKLALVAVVVVVVVVRVLTVLLQDPPWSVVFVEPQKRFDMPLWQM